MAEQKALLQLNDVKMHFPLKKESILQREKQYVKAVDGVTFDIYEGETFGLVGESGCGKSTLGRVILQLYEQTNGSIHYRGITLNDYAPAYANRDASGIPAVKGTAQEMTARFPNQVRLAGGLLLASGLQAVAQAITANLAAVKETYRLRHTIHLLELKRDAYLESKDLSNLERGRLTRAGNKLEALNALLTAAQQKRDECDAELTKIRETCAGKPGYQQLEDEREISIDLSRLKKEEMRRLRRYLQIIFQDPYSSLNQRFTVGQLISEALVAHGMYGRGTRQLEEYVLKVMDNCGLQNYFLHRYPHQFSGGQRQRVGIARALALQPRFVVCDEAVSALDVSIQSQIINLLIDLKEKSNLTYLFISHDLSTVKFISDRVAVMYLGNFVELGDSEELFEEPLHPYTHMLLEAIPTTDEESKKELQIMEGDIPSPINPPPG
jgi:peptide/nickel transport system ATP-binding protein